MKKYFLHFIITLSVFVFPLLGWEGMGFSQNTDSLWKVYNNKTQPDTNRLKALNIITKTYLGSNPDTAIILATTAFNFAEKTKQNLFKGKALKTLGICYSLKGDYINAQKYYSKALQCYITENNLDGIAACKVNIGIVYFQQSNYPKSLASYLDASKIFEKLNNKEGLGKCLNNIGIIYDNQNNYTKALECFFKNLKICEEMHDENGIGDCYSNIGNIYTVLKNYAKAIEYQTKSLQITQKADNTLGIGISYSNIGDIYLAQLNLVEALKFYNKAIAIFKEIGNKKGIEICYNNLGTAYLKSSSFNNAIKYADSSKKVSLEIGDIEKERKAYQIMALANAELGKYKEAYENHVQFKQLTDSIFNAENSKQLGDMKTQFEVEKKEAELKIKSEAEQEKLKAIANEEKKIQNVIIYAVAGVLLIVVLFSLFLFKRFRITQRQKTIIEKQKVQVDRAYESLHEKNKEVMDSINYASRIQRALLPSEKYIENNLNRLGK